jgi:predicted dinucleotide-binding enzyme
MVVLAVMWPHVPSALASVADWKKRVLIDATNRVASLNPFSLGDLSGPTSSEIVANYAAGAKVVKAFNSVPMPWISDFSPSKARTVLFVSGDDVEAKMPLHGLIEQFGFQALDLGSLATGGRLQQLGGPLAGLRLTFNERLVL